MQIVIQQKKVKEVMKKVTYLFMIKRTSSLIERMYDKDVKCVYQGKASEIQIFFFYFMARSQIPFQSLYKFLMF